MTPSAALRVVKMASLVLVHHAHRALKVKLPLLRLGHQVRLQLQNVFALKSRMEQQLLRLRKQENNHAATSTQKVS